MLTLIVIYIAVLNYSYAIKYLTIPKLEWKCKKFQNVIEKVSENELLLKKNYTEKNFLFNFDPMNNRWSISDFMLLIH